MSFFKKIKNTISSFSKTFVSKFKAILRNNNISSEDLDNLEESLIKFDVGAKTSSEIIKIIEEYNLSQIKDTKSDHNELEKIVYEVLVNKLKKLESEFSLDQSLNIIITAGVNGAGKTTTIAKLCKRFEDKNILVASCDTFRAAAEEQLFESLKKTKAKFFYTEGKNTPDSVSYKAINYAKDNKVDLLFLDTSGRFHNNQNLMDEFSKISKISKKIDPLLDVKVILILDGNSGQNLINQIEVFSKSAKIDGIILTKLDGLAKGGIIFQLADKFSIPIYFLGVGEKLEDLKEFKASSFVEKLMSEI